MASLMDRVSNFFGGNDAETGEGLRSLFINELKAIYYAEKQAVDALGEQADASSTDEVRNAFLMHQEETRNQIMRLERVFDSIGVEADSMTCEAIDGLAEDAQKVVSMTESGSLTRDAGLIIAGQKVEHHEIAAYGSAVTLAKVLGYREGAQLLEQTLQEEKNTDQKLTQLAESFINQRAASESDVNNTYGNRDNDAMRPDGTRYDDRGSTGQTYQSGSSYSSGSQMGSTTTYGSGTVGSSPSSTGTSNDATLGGMSGV